MGQFSGKTAVVTGSGRRGGLGKAIAGRLAADGAAVVISEIGASRDAAARSAAIELGPHAITVNNVCPSHVATGLGGWQNEHFAKVVGSASEEDNLETLANRIPLKRPGLPEDTANAVAFLCSDQPRYITAESMNVSGGEEPH